MRKLEVEELNRKIERLQKERKQALKQQREEEKKTNRLRFLKVGEITVKYFPQFLKIAPSKKKQEVNEFEGLESFFRYISSDSKLMGKLDKLMEQNAHPYISGQSQDEQDEKLQEEGDNNG